MVISKRQSNAIKWIFNRFVEYEYRLHVRSINEWENRFQMDFQTARRIPFSSRVGRVQKKNDFFFVLNWNVNLSNS